MSGIVLVTGGLGFIGSQVVEELVDRGDTVRVLDCLHPVSHSIDPGCRNPGAQYVVGDVRDGEVVRGALRGVVAVCHQAAMVGLGVDFGDVAEYVAHNALGTAVLLRELDAIRFRGRLVLASSMVVYGEGAYECSTHGLQRPRPRRETDLEQRRFDPGCPQCGGALEPRPISEQAPTDPRNVYAATKLHQEHLCTSFGRERGASVVALRYHNVYGPGMPRDTPYAGVASIFRSALERGEAPEVFEDGRQLRDFVHVEDVARANLRALDAEPDRAGAYNIATGRPQSVGQMAAALTEVIGGVAPVVSGRYRLGDVRHVFASPQRAAEQLGFEAMVGFREGMKRFATASLRTGGAE